MPVSYHYDKKAKAVLTHPSGVLTLSQIREYFERVYRNPEVESGFVEVVLFDDVLDFAFRYTEASAIEEAYIRFMVAKGCARTVFIARNPLGHGIAQMLSLSFGKNTDLSVVRSDSALKKKVPGVTIAKFGKVTGDSPA
jgi:hypothetical protein